MTLSAPIVDHVRTVLLWPLQIRPGFFGENVEVIRTLLEYEGPHQWVNLESSDFTPNPADFQERHYKEFITFQPAVQRFLYGEGRSRKSRSADDPALPASVEVYRRADVAALRVRVSADSEPITLKLAHLDLYFFLDEDVALLNLEVWSEGLPLPEVLDFLYRFGRAYPAGWEESGVGHHNLARVEILNTAGEVVAISDTEERDTYLRFVCEHRSPYVAAQWRYLLMPMVLDHGEEPGRLRFKQIEFYRMPMMVFLALSNPRALTREDFIHITQVATVKPGDLIAPDDPIHNALEREYFYDRYWTDSEDGPNTRFICTGNTLIVVGESSSRHFMDAERGVLAQFRHQYFVSFMIAHFHRAALLSFSDWLSEAINDLDVRHALSVRKFKRRIWATFQNFLTFTHRYWFHQISELDHIRAVFDMTRHHLETEELYEEVKDQVAGMSDYLDSDSEREQSEMVIRLTVVTVVGLIFSVVTGFFGMNFFAMADEPAWIKIAYFFFGTFCTIGLLLIAVTRSRQLAEILEKLSANNRRPPVKHRSAEK